MRLPFKVLFITVLMLVMYGLFLGLSGVKPRFAESNFVANQMRLQSLDALVSGGAELGIVNAGSSITSRIVTERIDNDKVNLNIGLDGSNAFLAANRMLDLGVVPGVLVIELNTIGIDSSGNDLLLLDGMNSGTARLARYFPLVRARSRPVTIIYSKLKRFKDKGLSVDLRAEDYSGVKPVKNYRFESEVSGVDRVPALDALILRAHALSVRVVLLMMPDGVGRPIKYGNVAEAMAEKYGVEVLDLKTPFADKMTYTDGLHLSEPSAAFITEVLSNALVD